MPQISWQLMQECISVENSIVRSTVLHGSLNHRYSACNDFLDDKCYCFHTFHETFSENTVHPALLKLSSVYYTKTVEIIEKASLSAQNWSLFLVENLSSLYPTKFRCKTLKSVCSGDDTIFLGRSYILASLALQKLYLAWDIRILERGWMSCKRDGHQ